MPTFEITAPDGSKYQAIGPDGATEQDALAQVQKLLYSANTAPVSARPQIVEFEGTRHEFPADFSQQDIAAALSSLPPAQSAAQNMPLGARLLDLAKSAGIGLVKGGIGLAGMPGDIAGLANRALGYVEPGEPAS